MRAAIFASAIVLGACAGTTLTTRTEVDQYGKQEFDAHRTKVTVAVVGALRSLGFEPVAVDAERGYVRTARKAVADVAPATTRSGGRVQTFNEYVVRIEPSITGTTRVILLPNVYWNERLVASEGVNLDLDLWRPRWSRFFRTVAANLAPAPVAAPAAAPAVFEPPPEEPPAAPPAPAAPAPEAFAPPPPAPVAPPPAPVAPPPAPAPAPVEFAPPPPAPAAPGEELAPLPDLPMDPG